MTTNFSFRVHGAAALILLALSAGCASSSGSSTAGSSAPEGSSATDGSTSTGTTSSETSAASHASPSEADTTPAQEGSGAESPQSAQKGGPTISVASLPVGGNTDQKGAAQCGHVNLIAHNELPRGISISIDSIGLSTEGVFTLGGDLCAPDSTPCTTAWTWTTDTASRQCTVAVTQVADSDKPVALVLVGTVHCPDQQACDDVQRSFDGNGSNTQIQFTPSLGVVSGGSSSSGSSDGASPSTSGT